MRSDDSREFGLIKSFSIDNGELEGLSPQECFVLGYELATIDERLKVAAAWTQMVHAENRTRIEDACAKSGRTCRLTWMEGDASEMWLILIVE